MGFSAYSVVSLLFKCLLWSTTGVRLFFFKLFWPSGYSKLLLLLL